MMAPFLYQDWPRHGHAMLVCPIRHKGRSAGGFWEKWLRGTRKWQCLLVAHMHASLSHSGRKFRWAHEHPDYRIHFWLSFAAHCSLISSYQFDKSRSVVWQLLTIFLIRHGHVHFTFFLYSAVWNADMIAGGKTITWDCGQPWEWRPCIEQQQQNEATPNPLLFWVFCHL